MNLAKLHSDRCFAEDRKIEWREVADETEIHRVTLSKMLNLRGYNATMANVDRLCRYFNCTVADLLTYIPDEDLGVASGMSRKGPTAKTEAASAGVTARYAKNPPSKGK
ncbi:MAG: helix-turn-helix transcriptional regulator [Burkholderiaceae bacterium]|nr:helix-turn-helix transcriptional regulator [Burkholderiaceae bacterium]